MHDDSYPGIQTLPTTRVNGVADQQRDTRGDEITTKAPWITLPEPYDNLEFRAWLSFPSEVQELLTVPKEDTPELAQLRGLEFLKTVILGHRGANGGPWRLEGKELPPADTDEFWQMVPNEIGLAIGECFWDEVKKGNESRASRRAKRRTWKRRSS